MMDTARESVLDARTAGRVVSIAGVIIVFTILFIETCTLFMDCPLPLAINKRPVPLLLVGISLTALWQVILCILMWWGNWLESPHSCTILVDPMLPIVYTIMKQLLYLLLFNRARVVHRVLKLNSPTMRGLRCLVLVSVTIGLPAASWWLFFAYWQGKVIPEGICVQYTTNIAGVIAVAVFDFVISAISLLLFLAPLSSHITRIRPDDMSPTLQRVLRRNLIISLALMALTVSSLTFMSIELSMVFGESPDPAAEHLQIWATFFPLIDVILTTVFAHLLTDIWIPEVMLALLRTQSAGQRNLANAAHAEVYSVRPAKSSLDGVSPNEQIEDIQNV